MKTVPDVVTPLVPKELGVNPLTRLGPSVLVGAGPTDSKLRLEIEKLWLLLYVNTRSYSVDADAGATDAAIKAKKPNPAINLRIIRPLKKTDKFTR